ncbi:MAG: hypothetical protein F4Y57_09650, partial [Acidobacteria bacterium]|nr:hypothetical protein [Acidobacteriota bacterium]
MRQPHPIDQRRRESILEDDVGEDAVFPGRQRRQGHFEDILAGRRRMDVGERRQRVRLHQEHVHQLAVVRQQRGPRQLPGGLPVRIVDRERENRTAAGHGDVRRRAPGLVNPAAVLGVDGAPPGPSSGQRPGERRAAERRCDAPAAAAAAVRLQARFHHALAHRRAEDGDGAEEQKQGRPGQAQADP